jgi:Family of unknown function (DUF6011)
MTMTGQITTLEAIKNFILAGDATFTLVSRKTGERKTFQVERTPEKLCTCSGAETGCDHAPWCEAGRAPGYFVRLLTGPDNTSDYRYLGFLFERDGALRFKINKQGWGADACVAFEWLLHRVNTGVELGDHAEFWHEGRCGRCGRPLTVPESIASGIGPVCAGRM